jgi:hypothetical protein
VRNRAPEHAEIAADMYSWAEQEADDLGSGGESFSFRVVNSEGRGTSIFIVYNTGRLELGDVPLTVEI